MKETEVIDLGSVEQVELGHGHCFVVKKRRIAIFRPRNGGIFAMQNHCPHAGGPLADGIIGEGKVVCPLHSHKYDFMTGEGSEKGESVQTYKVEEKNGRIFLEI